MLLLRRVLKITSTLALQTVYNNSSTCNKVIINNNKIIINNIIRPKVNEKKTRKKKKFDFFEPHRKLMIQKSENFFKPSIFLQKSQNFFYFFIAFKKV